MKVGIAGFAGSGKSIVFQWLTEARADPAKAQHGQIGVARIPDDRLTWLSQHFKPKKTTPATLEFLDTPGLLPTERRDNPRRLAIMRDAGGLLVVLDGFSGGDVVKELTSFREELLFADLEVVTGRVSRLEDSLKKPRPGKQKELEQLELALVRRIVAALESGQGAASLGLKGDEEKMVRSFQLLTLKPEFVLVNISETRLGQPLPPELLQLAPGAIQAPVKFELELEELSPEDREMFAQEVLGGQGQSGISREAVLRTVYDAMGQQVFFTVGEDECRAWSIPKGATAVEGAGEIHTDLARGFVRAEVVTYDDFKRVGSMKEAKAHGVYRLESKTYVVQDGDIMHILASG
ncbi:MAG: redox-regulated ATPase YchF [Gemmataceae bacterium]|nr:redox-regulated ATPase YchF [Gemmataceae bacterium]